MVFLLFKPCFRKIMIFHKNSYFLAFSSFSLTARYLKTPFVSVPGFNLTIFTLKGSMVWISKNIWRWVSIRRETVLWCNPVLLLISLYQSQPSSACFRQLTILTRFFAISFLILISPEVIRVQLAHIILNNSLF